MPAKAGITERLSTRLVAPDPNLRGGDEAAETVIFLFDLYRYVALTWAQMRLAHPEITS